MVLQYNAQLCESIGGKVGGEVRAHRIQMWNVVWVPRPVRYFCWRGRNPGHITSITHSAPAGFVGLYNWMGCNGKYPLDDSNEVAPLAYLVSSLSSLTHQANSLPLLGHYWAVVESFQRTVDCSVFSVADNVGSNWTLLVTFAVLACLICSRGSWWKMTLYKCWCLFSLMNQKFDTSREHLCSSTIKCLWVPISLDKWWLLIF